MTDELKQFVSKVASADEQTWSNIENIVKEQGLSLVPDVAEEIQSIFNEEYLERFPEEERLQHAARIYLSRAMRGQLVQADPHEIFVLDKTEPRTFDKRDGSGKITIANLYGVGKRITDDDEPNAPLGYIRATFFDEDVDAVQDADRGETYRAVFSGSWDEDVGEVPVYDLNGTSATSFSSPMEDAEEMEATDVVEQLFDRVLLTEADQNISSTPEDVKLIKANVIVGQVGTSDSGNKYGRYTVMDESVQSTRSEDGGLDVLSAMVDPSQVRWGGGSELYIIGAINNDEEYGLGMDADAVIPSLGIPNDQTPDTTEEESEESEPAEVDSSEAVNFDDFE